MIFRRDVLQRDDPTDFKAVFQELRTLTGWGTSDFAFILNRPRTTVREWEHGREPGYDEGKAIMKLLANCRVLAPRKEEMTA